jgi:YbbR domain-containing protein
VYVDSIGVYSAGAVNSINTNLNMVLGTHQIVVRAWDTSGTYGDQAINATVDKLTVTVSSPSQGATVHSPINVQATGKHPNGEWMKKWWVYLDNVEVYNAGAVGKIDTNIEASSGSHTLKVKAQDSGGDTAQQTLTVTVR